MGNLDGFANQSRTEPHQSALSMAAEAAVQLPLFPVSPPNSACGAAAPQRAAKDRHQTRVDLVYALYPSALMLLSTSTRRLYPLGSGSVVAMRLGARPSSSSAAGGGKTKLVILGTGWGGFRVGRSLGHCWCVVTFTRGPLCLSFRSGDFHSCCCPTLVLS